MRNFRILFLLTVAFSVLFVSCSDDDDAPVQINPEETITRVVLTITPTTGSAVTATWNQGETAPTVALPSNMASMSVAFFDATDPNDIENITTEVIAEADEHFVEYRWTGAPDFRITRASDDVTQSETAGGAAIGIRTDLNANSTAITAGVLEVELEHEPTAVDATCDENNCGEATGGEQDVLATFNFTYTPA